MPTFTKREKIVLIILGIFLPIIFTTPQHILDRYEMLGLLFIVLPLGILIATDPERGV